MSKLSFVKYEGAGNDFILIDDRVPSFDFSLVQRLCDRKFGIGADGLILLQTDSAADFRMRIFNSDGSEAESCGNGLRCLLLFIADLGLPKKNYAIATGNRIVQAGFEGEKIGVEMGAPRDLKLRIPIDGFEIHTVDTGVPHAIRFVSDVQKIDVMKEGAALRRHSFFQPRGTNVNFAAIQGDGSIRVRTFERGVEGETLACGTGAAAVAVAAHAVHGLKSPIALIFPGGAIEIHFEKDPFSGLKMIGSARRVFTGKITDS